MEKVKKTERKVKMEGKSLSERGSWKEGYEGLWKLALLIIFRASVSFKPRKVVMFTKQFFHLKILNSSKRMKKEPPKSAAQTKSKFYYVHGLKALVT